MFEIHTDQIWVKTKCAPIDVDTKKYFEDVSTTLNLPGVLTHCIDHSYDNEADPIKRQTVMLDQLESLQNMCYTNETLLEYGIRARNNQMLLKQYKDNWPEKLKKYRRNLNK